MAYRPKRRTRQKSAYSRPRRTAARTRRRAPVRRASAPQTLRIVVEQSAPSSPVEALTSQLMTPTKPKKARF